MRLCTLSKVFLLCSFSYCLKSFVALVLLLVGFATTMAWWAGFLLFSAVSPYLWAVTFVTSFFSLTTLFVMGILVYQWSVALHLLVKEESMSHVRERLLCIALLVLGGSIVALVLAFGIWRTVTIAESLSRQLLYDSFVWNDPRAMGVFVMMAIVASLLVVFALFLLVSTIIGFCVFKRKQFADEQVSGVRRFVILSAFLLVGFAMLETVFLMTEIMIVPEWFVFLMRTGGDAMVGASLLYYLCMATRSVYMARASKSSSATEDMSVELLSLDSHCDVPQMYENI